MLNSSLSTTFLARELDAIIDGTSSLTLRGAGNPVNGSTVDLSVGGIVNFADETVEAFTTEHLSKFTVNGSAAVIGTNLSVVSDGGVGSVVTAITAVVPEPASVGILTGIAGVLFSRRRRR